MWFALEQALREADGVEQLLPQLETVRRFADELKGRVSAAGVDGVAGVLAAHRRLLAVFDGISGADLERLRAQAAELQQAFAGLATMLEALRRLKETLSA